MNLVILFFRGNTYYEFFTNENILSSACPDNNNNKTNRLSRQIAGNSSNQH
jgi:hypothetical protein